MRGLLPSPGDNGQIILYFSYISMGLPIRQAGAQQEQQLLHHQFTVGLRLNTSLAVPSAQISQPSAWQEPLTDPTPAMAPRD